MSKSHSLSHIWVKPQVFLLIEGVGTMKPLLGATSYK